MEGGSLSRGIAPDFLVVGHVTRDLMPGGREVAGGAALYAALTALRLGRRPAVLTSFGQDFPGTAWLAGIPSRVIEAPRTSTFRTLYHEGRREQVVEASASPLDCRELPDPWRRAPLVYLCPVLHEVSPEDAGLFEDALVAVAPQGWLREWDDTGRVRPGGWEAWAAALCRARVVIVSEEDLGGQVEGFVSVLRGCVEILVVTRADRGSVIHIDRKTLCLGAYPARPVDPTGAGDCFGAAFLVRYAETGDAGEAGRFASAVGACAVEGEGPAGVPTREQVEARIEKGGLSVSLRRG